jgi:hypothetical protein
MAGDDLFELGVKAMGRPGVEQAQGHGTGRARAGKPTSMEHSGTWARKGVHIPPRDGTMGVARRSRGSTNAERTLPYACEA